MDAREDTSARGREEGLPGRGVEVEEDGRGFVDEGAVVACEEDRPVEGPEHVGEVPGSFGVKVVGRLVEDEDGRRGEEGRGEFEPTALPG